MLWALENPERLLHERKALEQLCGASLWMDYCKWGFTKDFLLKADVGLIIGSETIDVELVYPNLFPDTPAFVVPRKSDTRLSVHQYGVGGVLCLEWGPDNWQSGITGADLIVSAYKLLSTEQASEGNGGHVDSRHSVTFGQEVRASTRRLIVTPSLESYLRNLRAPSEKVLCLQNVLHSSTSVVFVSEVGSTNGQKFTPDDLPIGISTSLPLFSWSKEGWYFKSETLNTKAPITNAEELLAVIHAAGFTGFHLPTSADSDAKERIVLLAGANQSIRALGIAPKGDGGVDEFTVIVAPKQLNSDLPTDPPVRAESRVGLVGLGSVGSKVAVSLARSGVRKFLLVDDDVLLPKNIERHELDWASVGVNKVDAVREALSLIAPGIDVQVRRLRIAGQESAESMSTGLDGLATCDVIVDATASPAVFVQLAAIAKRRSRPLVWGEVFAGGIGALLVRSRPLVDPQPLEMRAGVYNYLSTQPQAPFVRETNYDATTDSGVSLIASDAEVSQFAAMLSRFVLDILLDRQPSEFPYSAYLIGFKKAWIFDAAFDTRPIDVQPIGGISASAGTADTDVREKVANLMLSLSKELTNDRSDPSS